MNQSSKYFLLTQPDSTHHQLLLDRFACLNVSISFAVVSRTSMTGYSPLMNATVYGGMTTITLSYLHVFKELFLNLTYSILLFQLMEILHMACHIKLITERLLWVFCQTAGQRSAIIGSCICPGSHHLVLCISNHLLCIV